MTRQRCTAQTSLFFHAVPSHGHGAHQGWRLVHRLMSLFFCFHASSQTYVSHTKPRPPTDQHAGQCPILRWIRSKGKFARRLRGRIPLPWQQRNGRGMHTFNEFAETMGCEVVCIAGMQPPQVPGRLHPTPPPVSASLALAHRGTCLQRLLPEVHRWLPQGACQSGWPVWPRWQARSAQFPMRGRTCWDYPAPPTTFGVNVVLIVLVVRPGHIVRPEVPPLRGFGAEAGVGWGGWEGGFKSTGSMEHTLQGL